MPPADNRSHEPGDAKDVQKGWIDPGHSVQGFLRQAARELWGCLKLFGRHALNSCDGIDGDGDADAARSEEDEATRRRVGIAEQAAERDDGSWFAANDGDAGHEVRGVGQGFDPQRPEDFEDVRDWKCPDREAEWNQEARRAEPQIRGWTERNFTHRTRRQRSHLHA
ncbi:MAG: hypothetical protein AAB074_20020 [Planctomycetota bacterium]